MSSLKMLKGTICIVAALGSCLAFSGCASDGAAAPEQNNLQEAPAEESEPKTVSYDFAGINLEIPDYWKADTEASTANDTLVFRTQDSKSTLIVMLDEIPQFMTVKAEGDSIVEATDEEIAESYFFSFMSDDHEQTIGDIEVVESGGSSYMRKTFRGTVDLVDAGETEAAQRSAIVLMNENSSYIEVTILCPEGEDEYLADADDLMSSIVSQL